MLNIFIMSKVPQHWSREISVQRNSSPEKFQFREISAQRNSIQRNSGLPKIFSGFKTLHIQISLDLWINIKKNQRKFNPTQRLNQRNSIKIIENSIEIREFLRFKSEKIQSNYENFSGPNQRNSIKIIENSI